MNNFLISVIIPMYNSEKTIESSIKSVLNQTYKNIEIIVIDDGSIDNSCSIVNKIKTSSKIILLTQKNKGPSSARNLGMLHSKGDFIAFLDSDDVWNKDKLYKQLNIFKIYPNIGIVTTRIKNSNYKKNIEYITLKKFLFNLKGFNINTPTVIIKKEVKDIVGYFDENMKYSEDAQYWFRILTKFTGIMINENLVFCGNGKFMFGQSGLSRNINKMYEGVKKNHRYLLKHKYINYFEFRFISIISYFKYLRRRLIVLYRRIICF